MSEQKNKKTKKELLTQIMNSLDILVQEPEKLPEDYVKGINTSKRVVKEAIDNL